MTGAVPDRTALAAQPALGQRPPASYLGSGLWLDPGADEAVHGLRGRQRVIRPEASGIPRIVACGSASSSSVLTPLARMEAHRSSRSASLSRSSIAGTDRCSVVTTEKLRAISIATCAEASQISTTGCYISSCSPSRPCSPKRASTTAS